MISANRWVKDFTKHDSLSFSALFPSVVKVHEFSAVMTLCQRAKLYVRQRTISADIKKAISCIRSAFLSTIRCNRSLSKEYKNMKTLKHVVILAVAVCAGLIPLP